jgi:CoA:oxalate CoA-transferase
LFVIAAGNDRLFEKLCIALNLPLSDDPRFDTNAARCTNARLLKRLIEAVTLEHPRAHWIARLTAAGIPTGPIQSVEQAMKDPQILARNMLVDVLDRFGRTAFKAAGNPIKMTGAADTTTRSPAPDLDGNRGEILRWLDD